MESGHPQAEIVEKIDEVRIRKSLDTDQYHIPSIVFELSSNRDDTVTVTVRDPIPPSVSIEDIGFHRQYGKDYWDIDGEQLVFEYELEPGEEFETIYGFRPGETDVSADFLTSPDSIDVIAEETTVPEPKEMTRSGAESPYQDETSTQHGSTDGGEDRETAGGVDLDEPADVEPMENEATGESVAERLATELQNGDVTDDNLDILAAHFDASQSRSGSEAARLEQLEKDVRNLRAYTNALEAFLDEEGTAQEIIDEFEQKIDTVEADFEALQETTSTLEEQVQSVESGLGRVDGSIDSLSSELEEFESEMESLEEDLDSLDERVPRYSIDERFDELQSELDSMSGFVENLKTAFE